MFKENADDKQKKTSSRILLTKDCRFYAIKIIEICRNSCMYIYMPHYCERYRFIKVFKDSGKIVRAFTVSRAIEEKRGEKTHLDII